MGGVKRIVCLANSRRPGGFCVAGKEFRRDGPGPWIRPVSARASHEVSLAEQRFEDGSRPSLLDIIDVPLLEARPAGHQQENWLIDANQRWEREGQLRAAELDRFIDPDAPLWNNSSSTSSGFHDEVSLADAAGLADSLRLIRVPQFTLSVCRPWNTVRVQGQFKYAGDEYWLWVTDPVYEEPYRRRSLGTYNLGECWLTVSLTEPFPERNACYKVIAGIIEE